MSGMPALDKGPKANCHGTALLASSAGIRQTPPQRSSVARASIRNLAQHQLRAIGEAVKFCRCPHTMASNKILPIATDVVVIRRRLQMGGLQGEQAGACTEYEASPEVEDRRSRGGTGRTVPPPPKGTYRGDRPEMDRSGPFSLPTGPGERALYRFPSLGWCCVFTSHFHPGLCALPVASTPINTTYRNVNDRVQAPKKPPSPSQMVN